MSDSFPLSLSYFIYQSSVVSNHCQYFLISDLLVQLSFSTLPHIHILKASGLLYLLSSYSMSDPYSGTLHSSVLPFFIKDFSISGVLSSLGMPIFLSLSPF